MVLSKKIMLNKSSQKFDNNFDIDTINLKYNKNMTTTSLY